MSDSVLPQVSVIIPVFNAAHVLDNCLESLLAQTYSNIHYIFVDDCSEDQTLQKLLDFKKKLKSNKQIIVTIVNHSENKGVANARNTGLSHATGEYIYWVDADDWIEEHTIASLVYCAMEENADIVGCNWTLDINGHQRFMNQPFFETSTQALDLLFHGKMRWNLWLFMVKKELFVQHGLTFIPHMNMGEDMMMMIKLFAKAKKVRFVNQSLYHYQQGKAGSITSTYTDKQLDEVDQNLTSVSEFIALHPKIDDQWFHSLKLNIKLPLLFTGNKNDFYKWQTLYKKSNSFIFKNPYLPFRTKIIQQFAAFGLFLPVKCYALLVSHYFYKSQKVH